MLPADVGGNCLRRSTAIELAATADPSLAASAAGFAAAEAGELSTSGGFVAVSLVELRASVDVESFFARWRVDYDRAACAAVGGVGSTGVRQVAGRSVDVASCLGGARTFHFRVRQGRLVVSILSLGSDALAEAVIGGLRGP